MLVSAAAFVIEAVTVTSTAIGVVITAAISVVIILRSLSAALRHVTSM